MTKAKNHPIHLSSFLLILLLLLACGSDDSTGPDGAVIVGKLTLSTPAAGKQFAVLVDNDINGDNGQVAMTTGACGSGTTVNYSISDVPAGNYFVYAAIFVVSSGDMGPQSGDYVGIYNGSIFNPPAQANVVVPSTGTVNCDIIMTTMP